MLIARYTEVLKNLLDNPQTKELIDNAMSTYPIYVSKSPELYGIPNIIPTREELNKKILDYYKYREIGFETVGRFIDELEIALKEIMPTYNQLMFSLDQDYDIKYNVDYTKTIQRDKDNTTSANTQSNDTSSNSTSASDNSSTSSNGTSYNKHVASDTPQGQLSVSNDDIDNVDYANEVTWNKDTANNTATTSGSSNAQSSSTGSNTTNATGELSEQEEVTERTLGNYGQVTVQSLIKQYRDLIANVEQQIINDPRITELFMLVY